MLGYLQGQGGLSVHPGSSLQGALAQACTSFELIEGVNCTRCSLRQSVPKEADDAHFKSNDGTVRSDDTAANRSKVLQACVASHAPLPDSSHLQNLALQAGLGWTEAKRPVARITPLAQCPKALVVQLRRGHWDPSRGFVKLSGHISFPETLDLHPYTSHLSSHPPERHGRQSPTYRMFAQTREAANLEETHERSMRYKLAAVIVHTGVANQGHYYVYRNSKIPASDTSPHSHRAKEYSSDKNAERNNEGVTTVALEHEDCNSSQLPNFPLVTSNNNRVTEQPENREAEMSTQVNSDNASEAKTLSRAQSNHSQDSFWWRISDQSSQQCSLQEVLASHATLLLYEHA